MTSALPGEANRTSRPISGPFRVVVRGQPHEQCLFRVQHRRLQADGAQQLSGHVGGSVHQGGGPVGASHQRLADSAPARSGSSSLRVETGQRIRPGCAATVVCRATNAKIARSRSGLT
jgi:hypothetical protein